MAVEVSVPRQELLHARGWDRPAGWGPLPSKDRSLFYYYTWVHQLSSGTSPVLANQAWAPPKNKVQDPGAILDPNVGLVPTEDA